MSNARKIANLGNSGTLPVSQVSGLGSLATKSSVGTADITDNSVVPAKLSQKLTLTASKASTSGTSVEFDSIPSWVNRITMTINGVSTNGSSIVQVQLGDAEGYETSGYTGVACAMVTTSASGYGFTSGHHLVTGGAATHSYSGVFYAVRINSTTWAMSSSVAYATNSGSHSASTKALSGQLDRIRLTTVNGTDTFDAGSVNILYE